MTVVNSSFKHRPSTIHPSSIHRPRFMIRVSYSVRGFRVEGQAVTTSRGQEMEKERINQPCSDVAIQADRLLTGTLSSWTKLGVFFIVETIG